MSKLSSSILDRIKHDGRAPLPRWQFVMKHIAIWLVVTLSLLVASIFLGSFIADLIRADWSLAPRWPGHELGFVRDLVTSLWLGGAVIALIGAIAAVRFTRRGYRYGIAAITTLIIGTSLVVGASLLPTPVPGRLGDWQDQRMPPTVRAMQFHNPTEGRLLGDIIDIDRVTYDTAWLTAIDGTTWELWLFDGATPLSGGLVQVFGETIDDHTFAALTIQPVPPHHFVQGLGEIRRMTE